MHLLLGQIKRALVWARALSSDSTERKDYFSAVATLVKVVLSVLPRL